MKIPCLIVLLATLISLPLSADEQPHLLGLALQRDAAYLGAKKEQTRLVPLINWQSDKFFARSTRGLGEAGLDWQLGSGISVGPQLAMELGRDSDDSRLLQQLQMPDIDHGVSLGAHIEYTTQIGPAPLASLLRLRQRSGSERGALADVRVELGIFGTAQIGVQTYLQATWANRRALMSDFGIAPENAARINAAAYRVDTGFRDLLAGVAGKIDLNRKWMVVAAIERRELRGDAAASPLAEQDNTALLTLGSLYRF